MKIFKVLPLLSMIIVPFESDKNFLDLQYKKLKPNNVILNKTIQISVKNTASPLFYKVDPPQEFKEAKISGKVEIIKNLKSEEKDTYIQLGVVYAGDYRPGSFVRNFLPEWLLKILSINEKYGVGYVDFNHFTNQDYKLDKTDSVRDIKMKFLTVGKLKKDGSFSGTIKLRDEKVLGLWLRADGDDHEGEFKTSINELSLN